MNPIDTMKILQAPVSLRVLLSGIGRKALVGLKAQRQGKVTMRVADYSYNAPACHVLN